MLLLPAAFAVYASSFSAVPVIEARHSVLGDADAANYVLLLREWSLARRYGDPYTASGRGIGDNAQKHKIHHVLYGMVGGAAHAALAPAFRAAGIPERRAVYAVNALLAVVNLVLLRALLRRSNPHGNAVFPFLLFYALALSTWVFSSVPESWPFSATLVLGVLLLLRRAPANAAVTGAAVGVAMLNNVFLGALWIPAAVALARAGGGARRIARRAVLAGAVALATWAAALTALSAADPMLRPDRFVRYTLWFRQFTLPDLPRTDPYVWMSAGSNLFVNSVVSLQPDPAVPQEALKATLTGSPLGAAATAAWAALALAAAAGLVRALWRHPRAVLRDPALDAGAWCAAMLGVTVALFYASGFLYSTVVLPAMAVLLCRHLDLRSGWRRALLWGTLALMLACNTLQVVQFRQALRALS
ncbi:MAG TPA: hypothetical protein VF142_05760 [Longimicrobium sp.]